MDYRSRSDNPNYDPRNDWNHPANVRERLEKENRRKVQEDRRSTNRGTPDRRQSPGDWRNQHGQGR